MKILPTLIAAAALATLPVLDAAHADTTGNLRIFRNVCLLNAPAFSDATIEAAAQKEIYSARDMTSSASVEWDSGRQCILATRSGMSTAETPPTTAEIEALVVETFNRLGGGKFTMKRVKADGVRYRIETPHGRFEISTRYEGVFQRFYVIKL